MNDDKALVPLPRTKMRREAYHEIAWLHLLETDTTLADFVIETAGADAQVREGAEWSLAGWCTSDLFLQCTKDGCWGDRLVVEVKGPSAAMNWGAKGWQTSTYESAYSDMNARGRCRCDKGAFAPPKFVLFDAKNRSAGTLQEQHQGLSLASWAVIGYETLLDTCVTDDPVAAWLRQAANTVK
jgi:hypothetical protein